MELTIIDKTEDIDSLIEYLKDKDYVSYDIETTGVKKSSEIIGFSFCADVDRAFYVITQGWDVASQSLTPFVSIPKAKELITVLKTKSLIMHNAIFDCWITENYFKVSLIKELHTDTMVLAHLLNENRKIGLKELGKEYYGEDATKEQMEMHASVYANGGVLTKAKYELYKADPYLIGKYGAKDAILTYKLFLEMVPELYEQKLEDFFYKDESMPLLKGATYELNTTGLKVDVEKLTTLKKTLIAECSQALDFITKETQGLVKDKYPGTKKKNTFNIGSNNQLAWLLFDRLKLEPGILTKEGKVVCKYLGLKLPYTLKAKRDFIDICLAAKGQVYQPEVKTLTKTHRPKKVKEPWFYLETGKNILPKLATRYEWIASLVKYNKNMKLLSTYVESIEERMEYGIIQPSFLQTGTTSGRYSSRMPNFQNLPRDDKRLKGCIVSRLDMSFVAADYSQLEPRVFAYQSGDRRLKLAFEGDTDFYSTIGMEVYDKFDCTPQKEGSSEAFGVKYRGLRDLSKVIALASTYGATAYRLASTTGKSVDDTAEDINKYFERFPDVKKMMLDAHEEVKKNGVVYNLFGRPRRIPDAKNIVKIYGDKDHEDLPYAARKLLNLSVNHKIQCTGASIVNRAAIRLLENCKTAGIDCKLVLQVHDSLIVECKTEDAENVALLMQDAMENTTILEGIRLEAVPKIGRHLGEV